MLVEYVLTGKSPLLMHNDDVEQTDKVDAWRKHPDNQVKKGSGPGKGDDRRPPWTWKTYLYAGTKHVVMPTDVIMAALRDAGAKMPLGRGSHKALTQTALVPKEVDAEFLVGGKPVTVAAVEAITGEFNAQYEAVKGLGFRLHVKRAGVGQAKHVRVRPCFDKWSVRGRLDVLAEAFGLRELTTLFNLAGEVQGLCDWRPGTKGKPGPYGRFEATVKIVK